MGMPSKGRQLRYNSGKKRFVLGSYDEADHPLVLAEFDKARERFFDDEEFWRYDMRYKLGVCVIYGAASDVTSHVPY